MRLDEALATGHKVRIDFVSDSKQRAFSIAFDRFTELARLFNMLITSLDDYGKDGIDYQTTLVIFEEFELCSGKIAEA